MENNNIDISEINSSLQQSYIHYDPSRVDYTLNNIELELLKSSGSSIWKDVFLATFGVGIPTLLNGFCDLDKINDTAIIPIDVFTNLLIGGISIGIGIICFIVWQKNSRSFNKLINQIKEKPKYKIPHH